MENNLETTDWQSPQPVVCVGSRVTGCGANVWGSEWFKCCRMWQNVRRWGVLNFLNYLHSLKPPAEIVDFASARQTPGSTGHPRVD